MNNMEVLPLISIIIPVYNVNGYLEKCLHSVCEQTYKNLEIIVVDDGSTDGSGEICDLFAETDSRIKVIHQVNGGQSSARNKGLAIARGEYIGFVDSDDWIDSDMYEFLYRLLTTNNADVAACAHYIETETETEVRYSSGTFTSFSSDEAIRALIIDRRMRNYIWDKLFRRQAFSGIQFPENQIFEDMAVCYRVFHKVRRIVMQDCPKYHYLQREGSTTLDKQYDPQKEYLWFLRIYEQVKFIQDNGIWYKAPCYVHKYGMHAINKIIMLPSSPLLDSIIKDIIGKMQEFTNVRWPQVSILFLLKRCLVYRHLGVYRLVKTFLKSGRKMPQT
ncbi:glycosyltransferase [uncultured Bacteroides sp.]|uniref:glycosyltransferase family 2 protein n=1 Tax=uncultured Bacteroides sp. TaxID=162156 RepID=UPI00261C8F48|nr:glycosyltransferase [uncultured Bacteroides sp.]